jgi:PTS system galactitol-specific IIB component
MPSINILTVCGSGTISSMMVSQKLKEALRELGIDAHCTECNNGQIRNQLAAGHFDCICLASPCSESFDVPCINAIGLLTGVGEDDIIEKVADVARRK